MPLIQRKRTILSAIRDVLIAPFVLILAMIWAKRWLLVIAGGLMLYCYFVDPWPIGFPAVTQEQVIVWGLVFAFIAIAAIPLALRDYLSNSGMETVWQADPACVREGERLARLLLRREDQRFHENLVAELRTKVPVGEFTNAIDLFESEVGRLTSIHDVAEVPIPYAVYSQPGFNSRFDAMVRVRFETDRRDAIVILFLKCVPGTEVVSFQLHESPTPRAYDADLFSQ